MNQNRKGIIIGLVLLIIILVVVIGFLIMNRKVKDAIAIDQDREVLVDHSQTNQVPAQPAAPKYEDTPESKVVKEESPAYITAFEKRADGYWYISVDYLQIVQGQGFKNENTKIRTFRASQNLKVYQFDRMLNESGTYFSFNQYKSFLNKEGGHYVNRGAVTGGPGTPNGYYYVFIENGQIMILDEFYDHEVNG